MDAVLLFAAVSSQGVCAVADKMAAASLPF